MTHPQLSPNPNSRGPSEHPVQKSEPQSHKSEPHKHDVRVCMRVLFAREPCFVVLKENYKGDQSHFGAPSKRHTPIASPKPETKHRKKRTMTFAVVAGRIGGIERNPCHSLPQLAAAVKPNPFARLRVVLRRKKCSCAIRPQPALTPFGLKVPLRPRNSQVNTRRFNRDPVKTP